MRLVSIPNIKRSLTLMGMMAAAITLAAVTPLTSVAQAAVKDTRQAYFAEAAAEFKVPEEILLGISYNQSRWENHKGQASVAGGYGLMHLTAEAETKDGRGDPARPISNARDNRIHTLDEAAKLIHAPADTLKKDDRQNIRGAAAVMAKYAKEDNTALPGATKDWYGTVARISGLSDGVKAQDFADDVYATIKVGASLTTSDDQTVTLKAQAVEPNKNTLKTPPQLFNGGGNDGNQQTECPPTINCRFEPARFAQNDPNDPKNYGNYDIANRPEDMKVKYIVIHDTEGSYQSAIDWFQDPRSFVAAHYIVRSSDGEVTQMVKTKDVGWHAGNWYMNMHSIGVEHEGFAAEGSTWYTEAMYRTSAKLVRYLADRYDVPLDREHIVGHEQYHGLT
ncbi:MAG: peptidoglycan recognition family protein, partial [Patescibacteria group bacterium]